MSTALASRATEQRTFQSLVDAATHILKDGRLEEARQACRTLTETHPGQPHAWFLYGAAALEAGDAATASDALENAVALHRAHTGYKRMLARAYRAAARTEEAAEILEHALRQEPSHPETMLNLGVIKLAQGEKDCGIDLCRRGLRIGVRMFGRRLAARVTTRIGAVIGRIQHLFKPKGNRDAQIAYESGLLCMRFGDPDTAVSFFETALTLEPEDNLAAAQLGQLLVEREQYAASVPLLEMATSAYPNNFPLRTDYAVALTHMLRFDEAIDVLESVFSKGEETPRALLVLGRAQTGAGHAKRARKSFKRALTLAPNSAAAHFALGRNLQEEGSIEEANRYFFDTLAIDPDHAVAYRFLASNKAIAPGDAYFDRMLTILKDGSASAADRMRLHFAAATIFEQAGEIETAFEHYSAGNDLKDVVFDPEQYAAHIGRLIETFDEEFFAKVKSWGSYDERPVFIVGMPRSGTSLIEQIMASHHKVFGAGELETFNNFVTTLAEHCGSESNYPECLANLNAEYVAAMAKEHLSTLYNLAPSASRITDKMPTNFLHIGLIATLFPNARIIHCKRDPRDTCFSIYGLDFAGDHAYAYDQSNLGRYFRQYERLMNHWQRVLPDNILDVQYEELIANQESGTRRMLEFCGLDWDENCLDFHKTDRTVRTWSYRQVRQPIYKTSVARWRKFEPHLKPLLDELNVHDVPAHGAE